MRKITSLAACLLLQLVASCADQNVGPLPGDPGTGGPVDPMDPNPDPVDPGTLTPQAYIAQLVTTTCEKAFSCKAEYPAASGAFADEWGDAVADCVTDDDDYGDRDAIAASITAGRITFDSVIAANCLANIGLPAACSAFFAAGGDEWADSCYDALAGNVADGGACTTSWDCGPDSDCTAAKCALSPGA